MTTTLARAGWFVALVLACGWAGARIDPPWPVTSRASQTLDSAAYVWHERWPEGLAGQAAGFDGALWIKVGELRRAAHGWDASPVAPDWDALESAIQSDRAAQPREVVLVIRVDERGAPLETPGEFADQVARQWRIARASAEAVGPSSIDVIGLQVDFDCPSRRLKGYARELVRLRGSFDAAVTLSITALPAWLDRPGFAAVTRACDSFVLQVHALRPPTSIDAIPPLVDPKYARRWVERAARYGRPFAVSLPTYSVRLRFDAEGAFVPRARLQERADPSLQAGERAVVLGPDAGVLAGLIRQWRDDRPSAMTGVAWFRVAEPGTELAWPVEALRAVDDGREPERRVDLELRQPREGLLEIVAVNRGETREPVGASIMVNGLSPEALYGRAGVFRDSPVGWDWRADGDVLVLIPGESVALTLGPGGERVMMWASAPEGVGLASPAGPSADWGASGSSSQRKEPWRGPSESGIGSASP